MKASELQAIAKGMAPAVKAFVAAEVAKVRVELEATRARVKELEATPRINYRGVWSAEQSYTSGDAVTSGGSLWIAKGFTAAKPGDALGADTWQLAVKRGRDGRDAR